MNISVLLLTSSALISHSPMFIGNNISFINGNFKKVSSLLFFNQISLLLKDSTFSQINGGIIHNAYTDERQDITGSAFSQDNQFNNVEINARSITIHDCQFTSIQSNNPLLIKDNEISLYITDTLFNKCYSKNGVIYLEKCRCITITHTCSYFSYSEFDNGFLFYNSRENDFSIILYNSIFQSNYAPGSNSGRTSNVFLKFGEQYLRCNNMTQTQFHGYQFEGVQCLSFAMSTIALTDYSCIYFSGSETNKNPTSKEIELVNLVNNAFNRKALITFGSQCSFQLTCRKCVFLTNTYVFEHESTNDEKSKAYLYECIMPQYLICTDDFKANVIESGSSYVNGVDTTHFTWLPFYTKGEYCQATKIDTKNAARGCNAGDCIKNCGRTFAFPDDVVPYTSIYHFDLQTSTFTPSKYFTKSSDFSKSNDFSESSDFSHSSNFLKSSDFTKSSEFSRTSGFSKTSEFTKTSGFTLTGKFSQSFIFSQSNGFTHSSVFSSPIVSLIQTEEKNREVPPFVPDSDSGNGGKKNNKGKMIGIIVGVVGAVAIAAVVTTVVLLKKRNKMESMSEGEVITQEANVISVDNVLQSEMKNDDPFAVDFQND